MVRLYSEKAREQFTLGTCDWSDIYRRNDVNLAYNLFSDKIQMYFLLLARYVPNVAKRSI